MEKIMSTTLIQNHTTAIIRSLIERIEALSDLKHKLTKGELRELFISNVLKLFLTHQFIIGSGIIINKNGNQSKQNDIIIYDNRVLPPFIKEQNLGVYPAESVIATIEVKSWLLKKELLKAEESAKNLHEVIYSPSVSNHFKEQSYKPICAIIGFRGKGLKELLDMETGRKWLEKNVNYLPIICLIKQYSWIQIHKDNHNFVWNFKKYNKNTNEETKRFIAVLLDNIRTKAEERFSMIRQNHRDWLGAYIRDFER